MKKLSVIIVTYNHEKHITKCIDSILKQKTDFEFDIILADDCSTDRTIDIVNTKYGSKVKVLSRNSNVGLCKNMYDAYLCAEGQFIFDCSGDDYLASDEVFQAHIDFLEKNEDFFSVYNWTVFSDESSGRKKIINMDYQEYSFLDFLQGKPVHFYIGTMRNTFRQDRPRYICEGGRNNEEIQFIYYTLSKGKKGIIPKPYYVYCYRVDKNEDNYNSNTSNLDVLEDYKKGFSVIEKVDKHKHNFSIAKLRCYERYIDKILEEMGTKGFWKILFAIKFSDTWKYAVMKMLIRLNGYAIPSWWLKEQRLCK